MIAGCSRRMFLGGLAAHGMIGARAEDALDRFMAWAREAAVPFELDDASSIALRVVGNAGVLALGEPAHGAAEPLQVRNALVRALLARGELGAVALETGCVEARAVDTHVLGGPGDTASIVRRSMTWGFGDLAANVDLVRMLREHNRSASRPVRFIGIDVPGGDAEDGLSGAPVALQLPAAALRAMRPAGPMVADLDRLRPLLDPAVFARANPAEQARLEAALNAARRCLDSPVRQVSNGIDLAAARDDVRTAAALLRLAQVWPDPARAGKPGAYQQALALRDAFMADRVTQVARRYPRMLVYAHLGHAMAEPIAGVGATPLNPMGMLLRARLGSDLRIVAITAGLVDPRLASAGSPGSWDAALEGAVAKPCYVDLRRAPKGWVDDEQTFRSNFTSSLRVRPRRAFDGAILIETLTPASRR